MNIRNQSKVYKSKYVICMLASYYLLYVIHRKPKVTDALLRGERMASVLNILLLSSYQILFEMKISISIISIYVARNEIYNVSACVAFAIANAPQCLNKWRAEKQKYRHRRGSRQAYVESAILKLAAWRQAGDVSYDASHAHHRKLEIFK